MKQRYLWIDNMRAIAMISMILYHGTWDLGSDLLQAT